MEQMEKPDKIEFQRLLTRYLAKEETSEEANAIMTMILSGKYDDILDTQLSQILEQSTHPHNPESFYRVYNKIIRQKQRQRKFQNASLAIAASLTLVFITAIIWVSISTPVATNENTTSIVTFHDNHHISLPDGSTVILNTGSTLTYNKNKAFNTNPRELTLEGEAFFNVTHDDANPFIVHAGNLTTTVLGTAFNINTSNTQTSVTVKHGKVSVADNHGHQALINTNEQITTNAHTHTFSKTNIPADTATAWMDDLITFHDATMEETLTRLEKYYGVKIQLANEKLKTNHITARFNPNDTLGTILHVICRVTNCKYRHEKTGVIIIDENEQ